MLCIRTYHLDEHVSKGSALPKLETWLAERRGVSYRSGSHAGGTRVEQQPSQRQLQRCHQEVVVEAAAAGQLFGTGARLIALGVQGAHDPGGADNQGQDGTRQVEHYALRLIAVVVKSAPEHCPAFSYRGDNPITEDGAQQEDGDDEDKSVVHQVAEQGDVQLAQSHVAAAGEGFVAAIFLAIGSGSG